MQRIQSIIIIIFIVSVSAFAQTYAVPEIGRPIERELKSGETHVYQITLKAGQFLHAAINQRGIDLVVRIFAPDGNKITEIDSPNGNQGDEPIALEAAADGTYRIEVSPTADEEKTASGRYEIRVVELLSPEQNAARIAENKRRRQAVIKWIKDNSIPVKTIEAEHGFEDLQPLKKILKDVRFVGLGEETHGTREFFQFKHRMLEFLVKEMGFRVFAIEASYSALQNINDYVMGKTTDGTKALDSQGFWTWNTEEVRAMLNWARKYNQSVTADKRVKFVGFDIQVNETGKTKLLEYLKRVAPERVVEEENLFKINFEDLSNTAFSRKGDEAQAALAKLGELKIKYNELFVYLELNGSNLAAKSNQAEYEQMRELARVIVQYLDAYSETKQFAGVVKRDFYMADNFRRIVMREPPGTRFVLWAHNGHISTSVDNGQYPHLGHYLRIFYGREYYALGFSFNQGSFQSRNFGTKKRLQEC